jgi:hypothetical protein
MLAVSACSGTHGRGGPESPEANESALRDEVDPRGWYCTTGSRTAAGDDEVVSELGFAPSEVLDFAIGRYEAPLRWSDDPQLRLEPETDESTIEIEIERAGDVMLFEPDTVYTGRGSSCEYWYEIPVRVTLRSDGGALDETFVATMRTVKPEVAFIHVSAEGGAVDGALAAQFLGEEGALAPNQLILTLSVSRSNVSGVIDADWSIPATSTSPLTSEYRAVAHWGAADCSRRAVAVDLAEPTYGVRAQSMIDRLTNLTELDLTWTDGSVTTAHAAFTTDAMGACITLLSYPAAMWAVATLDGVLQLQTEDGRLDGTYAVAASIDGDTAEPPIQHSISVRKEIYASDGPMTPAELGFVRIPVTEVPRPSFSLNLILEGNGALNEDSAIILWRNELVCEPDPAFCTDVFEAAERGAFSR